MNKEITRLLEENAAEFKKYYDSLIDWNGRINLTAITEPNEVKIKHFEDSLYGIPFIPQNATLCDVGTGAGFPGLPLKIVRKDIKLTLLDSLNKRVDFLRHVCGEIDIQANCIHTRAEDAGKGIMRESFDVVTARAVAKLNTLSEYCLPLVKTGGKFLAYKAVAEGEIEESLNAIDVLGGKIEKIEKFALSNGDGRSIVVVKKIRRTPLQYPRGKGKERSKPL